MDLPSYPADRTAEAESLSRRFADHLAEAILSDAITALFPGRIALVSSFGTEAAVILHFVAKIDRHLPILFLDTGKHFGETLTYRDILIDRFGFTDARAIAPAAEEIATLDADGELHKGNPALCCHTRKVLPLRRALAPFDAWITGRKRFQASSRANLPLAEAADGRIKINPLARWSQQAIDAAFKEFKLPRHPLFHDGYRSIGCAPCTRAVAADEDSRAGRWSGSGKIECGIHI